MIFTELTEKEFEKFSKNHPQASFMQTVELAHLKEEQGKKTYFLGVKEENKVLAATLIFENNKILGHPDFYAPRGFLIDYDDLELLTFFSVELIKFVKKKKGFRITLDPNVIYRIRSSEGNILDDDINRYDDIRYNLEELGYRFFGFNIYNEARQVRWEYRLDLDEDYETKKAKFSKSTRKNIDACYKKGLRVRKGTIDDLDSMTEIFDATSQRKNFESHDLDYYKRMYRHMHDFMTIYIAYLDPDIYVKETKSLLDNELKNNKVIQEKMKTGLVGSKLTNQKSTSDNLIKKYQEELEKAKIFKKENPNGKDIGALLSLKSGTEYLTLSSGILSEYKSFTPKYAMYNEHIKDAYELGYKCVDFYGITGCFDPKDKYYGMYEFKKGFNGYVVELIGQFEYGLGLLYPMFNFAKKIKLLIFKR